jgi:hypothetical protein
MRNLFVNARIAVQYDGRQRDAARMQMAIASENGRSWLIDEGVRASLCF